MANSASWEKIFKDNKILEHDFSKTPFYLSAKEIKKSVEEIFNVKVENINTCNRGTKKIAYVKLNKKNPAIDVATKLGMI